MLKTLGIAALAAIIVMILVKQIKNHTQALDNIV